MIREIREEELEHRERDTEITLGAGMLLAIGCGLILLCILCFSFGYSIGHRNSTDSAIASAVPTAVGPTKSQAASSGNKPAAGGQAPAEPPARAAVDVPADTDGGEVRDTGGAVRTPANEGAAIAQSQSKPAVQPQVRPALAAQTTVPLTASVMQVQPALSHVSGWMVQIAAVSHSEDAEVLVNALRKRGYAVTVRRDVSDTLLHVQVGPFANRSDANAMRQKLQSDGYNAVVAP
jgi:cell division septation protein DedD